MPQRIKTEQKDRETPDMLMEVMREGARQLLAQALEVEVAELLASHAEQQDAGNRNFKGIGTLNAIFG